MTRGRAGAAGWAIFALAALLTAAAGAAVQLAFAAVAILALGLPHGASDMALVASGRRGRFLLAYGGAAAATLALWIALPIVALTAFLLLSAAHFGFDDAPRHRPLERAARAFLMVGGPAVLHAPALEALFAALTDADTGAATLATAMRAAGIAGAVAAAALLPAMLARGETNRARWLAAGGMAMLALPPLVGFPAAFVALHARGQTAERMRAVGARDLRTYLRGVAPILAGATLVLAGVAAAFAGGRAPAASTLFAGIAVLAVPHMLVMPWYARCRPVDRTAKPSLAVAD